MGPLAGIRVLEFEAIGPAPFAGMLLADMGADVLVVDRPADSDLGLKRERWYDVMMRGKRSVTLDLKSAAGSGSRAQLCRGRADALIEGFRPGVMERLGLGPEVALARNPRLVYGRMTGWGQDGPLAPRAGHDINYIALAGVLHAFGRHGEAPVPPLNLVGDFGGGGMLLAFGVACALLEAGRSGKGQVVDAAMVEGASLLAAMFSGFLAAKQLVGRARREHPRYRRAVVRRLRDPGRQVRGDRRHRGRSSIDELLSRLNLEGENLPGQYDRARWPEMREIFRSTFKSKTRDEWCRVFEGSDACFAPVLTFSESRRHPHNAARGSLRRGGRRGPARPGAAVFAHAGRGAASAAGARRGRPRRRSPTGASARPRWNG